MVRNQNQEIIGIWRYGIFWRANGCVDCIMEYHNNDILFYLNGSDADITSERYRIYNELIYINKKLNISSAEFIMIFCNDSGEVAEYSYNNLRRLREMKQKKLVLPEISKVFDVRQYAGYFPDVCESQTTINIERVDRMTLESFNNSKTNNKNNQIVKILFLAANPNGTGQLKLDEEAREINDMIRKSEYRDTLVFESRWAVRALDILQAINEINPTIIHFSGHGTNTDFLVLQDLTGNPKYVSADAIVQTMLSASESIKLIFFNTCFSIAFAQSVTKHLDAAIGMKESIGDLAARVFAAQFYSALGFGKSIISAFEQAKAALMLEGIREENTPCLFIKSGINANETVILNS
jgi:hypothetical protein